MIVRRPNGKIMEETIFTKEELTRITKDVGTYPQTITVDVHGMSCQDALRFVKNIVALHFRDSFNLIVIHGYNGGTAIKETITDHKISARVRNVRHCWWNPGITTFQVA